MYLLSHTLVVTAHYWELSRRLWAWKLRFHSMAFVAKMRLARPGVARRRGTRTLRIVKELPA